MSQVQTLQGFSLQKIHPKVLTSHNGTEAQTKKNDQGENSRIDRSGSDVEDITSQMFQKML